MNRVDALQTAIKLTTGDRDKTYGSPVENMGTTAELFEGYFRARGWVVDHEVGQVTAEDVAVILALLKLGRVATGLNHNLPPHADNYIDGACYTAIAGECAFAEREE